ncbi:MAG: glycosyltransferase family 4 protein, partial [Lachnospiraceae bacterium]|nr:glycosyltransferase family 4 protein [Lachnospiraceae bacterium]
MKVLHLLSTAAIGGLEVLCCDIAKQNSRENVFAFLFAGGPMEAQMQQIGVPVYAIYQTPKWNVGKRIQSLSDICEKEKIDIVVVHNEGISILIYYMLLMKIKKECIYIRYLHSAFEKEYYYHQNFLLNAYKKYLTRQFLKKSDKMVAVSGYVKKSFVDNFMVDSAKIEVIYNGIDMNQTEKKDNRDKNDTTIELLYMGRLVKVKGIDILLKAMSKVIEMYPEIILRFVGDGPDRALFEEQTRQLGLTKNILFEGFHLDKGTYFRQADIFIYPSRWQEAFGISIVEAMSYGLVCIASEVGGIPEIIEDGINGYLFEKEDSYRLEKKIEQAIQQIEDDGKQKIVECAKKTAQKFRIEHTVEQLEILYSSLIKKKYINRKRREIWKRLGIILRTLIMLGILLYCSAVINVEQENQGIHNLFAETENSGIEKQALRDFYITNITTGSSKRMTEEMIRWWRNEEDDKYYIFLPSSANMNSLRIQFEGVDAIYLDGKKIKNAEKVQITLGEHSVTTDVDETSYHVVFMQSNNLPTAFIHTESGTMDYVNETKGNKESGTILIIDENGDVKYSGPLEYIAGRGNATWDADKKGYKIKFPKKQNLFHMGEEKSW